MIDFENWKDSPDAVILWRNERWVISKRKNTNYIFIDDLVQNNYFESLYDNEFKWVAIKAEPNVVIPKYILKKALFYKKISKILP